MGRDFALRLLAMAAAAAGAYALSRVVPDVPCWALFLLVAAVAWPIWVGEREYALFRHRLAIAATTLESSRVRRWFWRGRFTSFVQMLAALFWAALLLAFAPLLDTWHLALLAADVVFLAAMSGVARALMARDVRDEYLGLVSRRWVLFVLNVVVLSLAFFVIDYFVVGAPDTRGMAWSEVASRAYGEFEGKAACPLAGMTLGFLNALDRLNWHAAQVLIPSLPAPGLELAAWAVFLLQAGLVSFAYTRLLLGALALVARLESRPKGTTDGLFPASLPVLALVFALGAYSMRDFDPATMRPVARAVVDRMNPCRIESPSLAAARSRFAVEIEGVKAVEAQRAATQIDQALDTLFADAEAGVDKYLDWYFSVLGEYQRLLGAALDAELQKAVLVGPRIGERLTQANQRIAADTTARFTTVAAQLGSRLQQEAAAKPCWTEALQIPAIPAIERDVRAATTSIASGLAVGGLVAARVVAGRFSQTVLTRLASRRAYGSAASVAGRVVGKRAGSLLVAGGTATAACAPGGPLAVLCGLVAGAVTWVTVDKALVMIDELRFRDEMRAEVLEGLREQKEELKRELRASHGALIDAMATQVHTSVDRVFIPARDG
jgi:hypothetical protein